jgi:hypothetical protein
LDRPQQSSGTALDMVVAVRENRADGVKRRMRRRIRQTIAVRFDDR